MKRISFAIALIICSFTQPAKPDDFEGKWSAVDQKSGGMSRIEIFKAGKIWKIRAWAPGDGGELDQGETTLAPLGDFVFCPRCVSSSTTAIRALPESIDGEALKAGSRVPDVKFGFAHWDYKFKDTYLTLHREKGNLIVEDFNIFKDDSERTNYRLQYQLKLSKTGQ